MGKLSQPYAPGDSPSIMLVNKKKFSGKKSHVVKRKKLNRKPLKMKRKVK